MQVKVSNFLYRHGMHYNMTELGPQSDVFLEEMTNGLEGKPSSLMMLPSYTNVGGEQINDKEVIAIDAGGTNLRIAAIRFCRGQAPSICGMNKYPMPGTYGTVDIQDFLELITDYLTPFIHKSDSVGFCFSFPAEILQDGDGRILCFNKEVVVDNATGVLLGKGINKVIEKRGYKPKTFSVVNDTVASMLAGAAETGPRAFGGYAGYILGTGTNTCYIDKVRTDAGTLEEMAINLESGGYDKFQQGDFDRIIDAQSVNPGEHQLEKMISGAYFGTLILTTVKEACKEGLFSSGFEAGTYDLTSLDMNQINTFCWNSSEAFIPGLFWTENDRLTLYEIIEAVFERAARFATVNLCAIMRKSGCGRTATKPVCISAEGTFFEKSPLFRRKLDYYNESFLKNEMGLYCEFIKAENATLIGAAAAAAAYASLSR